MWDGECDGGWLDGGQDTATGLLAGTRVATAMGWRPVEALTEGDRVLTFDNGLQVLTGVTRVRRICRFNAPQHWPVLIPAGVLGNCGDVMVMPDQPILLESDLAEVMTGDPFALVTAAALDDCGGIGRVLPDAALEVVILTFAEDQVIFTKSGPPSLCQGRARGAYAILAGHAAQDICTDVAAPLAA